MAFEIKRTSEMDKPSLVLTIYGEGGVGKSTLAATAPKPVFIDAEEGTKAFGARGIDVPVALVNNWGDVIDAWKHIIESKEYETVIIDPIDVFLFLLIEDVKDGGSMNIGKWGLVKERMRKFIYAVKSSGKHIVFIAHEDEKEDEGRLMRRPKLAANLSDELVNMSDVLGHLRVGEGDKRVLLVQPTEKWKAKDRYDAFGKEIEEPNITTMVKQVHDAYNREPFPDAPESKKKQV